LVRKATVNQLIDELFHPTFKKYGAPAIILDGIAHGIVEGDPLKALKRFTRHNEERLLKELSKKKRVKE
jgi:hypothetical protein